MKNITLCLLAIVCSSFCQAQVWELHVGMGTSLGKLLPTGTATQGASVIHFGFGKPGKYFAPELDIKTGDHSRFSLGYQLSVTQFGIQVFPAGFKGSKIASYDGILLQNFSVGYSYTAPILNKRVIVGGFAKAGIAHGELFEIGGRTGSGKIADDVTFMMDRRLTDFEVMPDFWTPTTTVGLIVGPNIKSTRIADRLVLQLSATRCWKDPYVSYSATQYTFIKSGQIANDIATWQGAPLLVQLGLDYSLFRFTSKRPPKV